MQQMATAANSARTLEEAIEVAAVRLPEHTGWQPVAGWVVDAPGAHAQDPADRVEQVYPATAARAADTDLAQACLATGRVAQAATTVEGRTLSRVALPVLVADEVVAVLEVLADESPLSEPAHDLVHQVAAQLAVVAERERAAAALAAARDRAMEASRMKSEFLATMSHEIRTPLNGVIGLNDLLMRTSLDADQQRLASRALLGVLNDILDFSKIEAGRLELEILDFEVREVVEQVAGVLGESARSRGLELVVSCAPEVPQMLAGDPTRLSQVLTNLVSNAIKFTEQGEVVVRATAEPGPDQRTYLRVSVSDTGIGVAPAKVPGLFDPFTQADTSTTRVYGGTGLGLAICREIVQAMGGTIGYSDNPGGGAVFTFSVLLEPSAGEIDDSADAHAREVLAGRRMLVVDDNPHNRTILAEQLGWWGVRAVAVDSAEEAVAAVASAARRGHPFEAVLLDMAMPGHDGLWLAHQLRASDSGGSLRLLMLTSMTQLDEEQIRSAGIDDLLVKPAPSGVLRSAVVDLVGGDAVPVPPSESEPQSGPTGRRILVVEDNPVNQMVAGGILEFLGYEHRIVDDGRAGVDAWAEGGWDAVLMDVQMPVLDGYAATREIRERETGTRVPVIAMTAAAIEGERERCLASGMDDYLTKPVDPAALAATLSHWLEGTAVDDTPTPEAPVTSEDRSDDVLEGLDTDRLEMLLDLDPDSTAYLDRAIGNFMTNTVTGLEQMREAIEAGDATALRQSSHRLAGGALNLGVTYAGEAVRQLEAIADGGTTEGAADLLDEVAEALERGRQALAAYQAGYQAQAGS